mmetsp:Transcript_98228/g.194586  ORF Transcript_98228/g.194586 Transcript_98228/m.194586 type:complete len:168 (+) Transcript_98228:26-529(+)
MVSASKGDETGPLNTEKLLPAVGVGAAVSFATGLVSLSTLGLVGLGAGVGYGVGTWAKDKLRDKRCQNAMDNLHPALKIALQQWQTYLAERMHGKQPTPAEGEMVFAAFAQEQPSNAQLVSDFVRAHGGNTSGGGATVAANGGNVSFVGTQPRSGGVTVVPLGSGEV